MSTYFLMSLDKCPSCGRYSVGVEHRKDWVGESCTHCDWEKKHEEATAEWIKMNKDFVESILVKTPRMEGDVTMTVTFEDFEKRYENIRKQFPDIGLCSVYGCDNPCDVLDDDVFGDGKTAAVETTCAYHRLLFDFWIMEVVQPDYFARYFRDRKLRRDAFSDYMALLGTEACDRIVLRMAQEGINWVC